MEKLGQHFLKDPGIAELMVSTLSIAPHETILEIGPGHGELTARLGTTCMRVGADILLFERDASLAVNFKEEVVVGDAVKTLPARMKGFPRPFKIIGNIPYYATGKILRMIGSLPQKPLLSLFMVQREVAERICAAPPHMNRLAASIQYWAEPSIVRSVSKGSFSPPPKVDSAIILLIGRPEPQGVEELRYYDAVRHLFAQPRKTIENNLRSSAKTEKALLSETIRSLGLDPSLRPQNLRVEDVAAIARLLF